MDNGFHIQNGVLSIDECDTLIKSIPKEKRERAGVRHLMKNASVKKIANDERLLTIARNFVGVDAIPYRATLFEKSGYANWLVAWHQDTALPLVNRFVSENWGPWSIKSGINYAHAPTWALERVIALRIHLDPSTSTNGPLRVIPGSHLLGVLDDHEVFEQSRKSEQVECLADKGGVIAMRPLLIHASSKALENSPRRVLHIEYIDRLDIADGIQIAIA